jgi:hypothetical protein
MTPELYFGAARGQGTVASPGPVETAAHARRADPPAARDIIGLRGDFVGADEWVEAEVGARVDLAYRARDVYVTARPTGIGASIEVELDGAPVPAARRGPDLVVASGGATLTRLGPDELRHLLTGPAVADGRLSMTVRGAPVRLYTMTFGG